mmetsp:Transcript_11878/g.18251  ORF Transcript_11878/g.18251 Transcript_11878/m.18251 type:complete len:89 (+) Transcript_11878:736-1002(+)
MQSPPNLLLFPKIYEINNETKIDILLREECGSIIFGSPMVLFSHRAQFSPDIWRFISCVVSTTSSPHVCLRPPNPPMGGGAIPLCSVK